MKTFESNCLMVFGWVKKLKKDYQNHLVKFLRESIRSLKEKIDENIIEEFEELLISSDLV